MEKINIARRRREKEKSSSLNNSSGKMKILASSIVSALNEIVNVIHNEKIKLTMEIFFHPEHSYCLSAPAFKNSSCLSEKGSLNKKEGYVHVQFSGNNYFE